MDVVIVVLIFSVVQSILGVGLLVFGTPTLLILGYGFIETLIILLPCSLVISAVQVSSSWRQLDKLKLTLPLLSIPTIAMGIYFSASFDEPSVLYSLIGVGMVLTAISRLSVKASAFMGHFASRFLFSYIPIMGLIHGLTNMGGALLTILASSLYSDKGKVRSNIAYGYLIFAIAQLTVIFTILGEDFRSLNYYYPVMAIAVYLSVGKLIYNNIKSGLYNHLVTGLCMAYGLVLLFTK
ncbi:hypothetical protein HCH_06530 [Hahella chejuensis KCTC 2396]|uniref:Probable membrane transporter protein n=1 Tax=Hahella chejuensis (strain KCTC 2396) TaxID=349521 RepID=Q2S855_HAHCH|nr:TSUP family transporter [Hahella chejuensis]ABC33169.1 hypothetical protein HCH_06530 [Hahella chejuensis KCTC 2396]